MKRALALALTILLLALSGCAGGTDVSGFAPGEAELGIIDYDVHWAGSIKEEFIARWTALIEEGGA